MKRVFSSPYAALVAGLCLRLFFVLRYPANSGDTVLYDQMATNWLKHHVYAMIVGGEITPVDLRMPGYPAYLAVVYALTGRTGDAAKFWVLLGQVFVDLAACVVIAALGAMLASGTLGEGNSGKRRRVFRAALWLGALCPFTANYVAVPLTEVWATFFAALALLLATLMLQALSTDGFGIAIQTKPPWIGGAMQFIAARITAFSVFGFGLAVGLATLFRPESPLLYVAAMMVVGIVMVRLGEPKAFVTISLVCAIFVALPLAPWTIRNAMTFHEFQPLAPKNSNLPGELVPYGFMAWEKTWLFRFRDVYLVPWKLNGEEIRIDDIPARAFDSAEEKSRVAAALEQYNQDLTLSAEEDAVFGQIAKERTKRHPLRTYVWLPVGRAITMWFTPRIELIPVSGTVFPLKQSWQDDKVDQSVTIGFFVVNLFYVGLAALGGHILWWRFPGARPAVALLIGFILLRTAFLTTLETPEPRYVLECFPAVIALAAQAFAPKSESV